MIALLRNVGRKTRANCDQTDKSLRYLTHLASHCSALALFALVIAPIMIPETHTANTVHDNSSPSASKTGNKNSPLALAADHGLYIGAYGGVPYTKPSDVHTVRPNGTDFTLKDVTWRGEPFKSPVYYGVRIAKWSETAPFGAMLDFTHSKAIANRGEEAQQSGTLNNKPLTPKAKISETFRKLEFSHGHNMLTLNGLFRLPLRIANISPYVGLGAGVSLPHTEIQFTGDLTRTYEYQYAGPTVQALFGLEFQLPQMSIFLEYKFSYSDYLAPLTFRNGSWVIQDLWAQFQDWRAGKSREGGTLTTTLASHQVIGGLGIRIARQPAH